MLSTETCVQKKPEAAPENRVGDFFSVSFSCVGQNQPQALEPHQAFSTTSTTTVSGVVYWLSKDPIGISGGLNLYVFCGNNPVNFTDPLGLCEKSWKDIKPYLSTLNSILGAFFQKTSKYIGLGMNGISLGLDPSTGTTFDILLGTAVPGVGAAQDAMDISGDIIGPVIDKLDEAIYDDAYDKGYDLNDEGDVYDYMYDGALGL